MIKRILLLLLLPTILFGQKKYNRFDKIFLDSVMARSGVIVVDDTAKFTKYGHFGQIAHPSAPASGGYFYSGTDDHPYWMTATGRTRLDSTWAGGGAGGALDDLTDVNTTGVALGNVLKWNGTNWVDTTDETSAGGVTFANLTDTLNARDNFYVFDTELTDTLNARDNSYATPSSVSDSVVARSNDYMALGSGVTFANLTDTLNTRDNQYVFLATLTDSLNTRDNQYVFNVALTDTLNARDNYYATPSSVSDSVVARANDYMALGSGVTFANLTDTLNARDNYYEPAFTTLGVAKGGTGATTLTGLLRGNGTGAFTAITTSSTVGQTLRVTGADTYAWGALDLADGDAITGILPTANGGTANAFFTVSGPASSAKTFTFPNASATVLTSNATVTVAQGGTGATTLTGYVKGNGTSAMTAAAMYDTLYRGGGLYSITAADSLVVLIVKQPMTVVGLTAFKNGGTSFTFNATRYRSSTRTSLYSVNTTASTDNAVTDASGGSLQNTDLAAGDIVAVTVRGVSGTVTEAYVQLALQVIK
jgi:hypothetical protein